MKQHTTNEQTAKLIELGFEKPMDDWFDMNYSIGELIEMLPEYIERIDAILNIGYDFFKHCWVVAYIDDDEYKCRTSDSELVDALYDMVVKLKEEKII